MDLLTDDYACHLLSFAVIMTALFCAWVVGALLTDTDTKDS